MSLTTNEIKPKIHLHLSDPSLTLLHRAGMAGLWMTLKQLEKLYSTPAKRPGNLSWLLTPYSISLNWQGQDVIVLDWLLKQSFQITEEGLICLTGLNSQAMDIENQITVHQGITGTFLQHNKFFKSAGNGSIQLVIDGINLIVDYQKADSYAHQDFSQSLCDENGELLNTAIIVKGWLYPGAMVRHYAFEKQTSIEETVENTLSLLFAPVACQYFILPPSSKDERELYVLVIPEVNDLQMYAACRWHFQNFSYKNFHVSGLGDAALKFIIGKKIIDFSKFSQIKRCQVIEFGKFTKKSKQKTRKSVSLIELNDRVLDNYQLMSENFSENKVIQGEDYQLILPNLARRIITDNLALGKPWWTNFSSLINNSILFKKIIYESNGLYNMVQNSEWDIEAQKLFVMACHEALRKTFAKIYDRTKEGEFAQIERKREQLRSQLERCKNSESFRQFIMDFWSRSGQISILQEHWQELLPLTTGQADWKIAKDLTLLALASYKKSEKS
jgi:CRISPR-associated protein Cas8a1/Csx13